MTPWLDEGTEHWWKCKSRSLRWLEGVHESPWQGKGGQNKSFLSHSLERQHQEKQYPLQCLAPLLGMVAWSCFSVITTLSAPSLVLSSIWPLPTSSPGSQGANLSALSFIRELHLISCMKSHLAPLRWSSRQHLGKSTWGMRFVLSLTGSNEGQDWRAVRVAGKMNARLFIYWQFLGPSFISEITFLHSFWGKKLGFRHSARSRYDLGLLLWKNIEQGWSCHQL